MAQAPPLPRLHKHKGTARRLSCAYARTLSSERVWALPGCRRQRSVVLHARRSLTVRWFCSCAKRSLKR